MKHDRHSRRHNNNGGWKHGRHEKDRFEPGLFEPRKLFRPTINAVPIEQIKEDEKAIKAFKSEHQTVCPKCGNNIIDFSTAMYDEASGSPVHFDCVLNEIAKNETLGPGDKVVYIGQGRFGVLNYPNIHDTRHFTIKKIIEREPKEKKPEWRDEMAELYSRVR